MKKLFEIFLFNSSISEMHKSKDYLISKQNLANLAILISMLNDVNLKLKMKLKLD